MKKVFIGIDISKDWLDVAIFLSKEDRPKFWKKVQNNAKAINAFCKQLLKKYGTDALWVCFEHTGSYGLLLSCLLEEAGIKYSAVSALEIKRSLGLVRGKNDKIDAIRIADYAATHVRKLKPSRLPAKDLLKAKQLLTYRAQLVKVRTQFKNSLQSHKLTGEVTENDFVLDSLKARIKDLTVEIDELDGQIEALVKKNADTAKNYRYATSVKGIGPVIAAFMLVSTHNFTAFDDARKYMCYTGLAPFENTSGTKKGITRTSNLANKKIKSLLSNGANSAIVHDPQIRKYYERKIAEGKKDRSVKNAVACKLVARMFAAVRRQSEYVVLQN